MSSAENSEACPEAQAGRRSAWRVGCIDPAGVPGIGSRYLDLPLQVSSGRVASRRSSRSLALTRRLGVLLRNCKPNSR